MAYDMAVARTAYATAMSMGASSKVMLALFEAAIVESGVRNLSYGDRDSVGFLQQRPSQGWPNPTDVPTATRSFISRAKPIEGKHSTAGKLAQAVQRSKFPLRYDMQEGAARKLIESLGGTSAVTPAPSTPETTPVVASKTPDRLGERTVMFVLGLAGVLIGAWAVRNA